jgi:lysozyme
VLRGIDISSWQNVRDWNAVQRSGIDFAIIKATGGTHYHNLTYSAQLAGARGVGMPVGHYHYAYEASVPGAGPEAEAAYFLDYSDIRPGEPVALDLEEPTAAVDVAEFAERFMVAVDRALNLETLLYTYRSYITERGLTTPALAKRRLWFASYPETAVPGPFPLAPFPWKEITIWQWSAFATIPGIGPNVDENLYPADLSSFRALGGLLDSPPAPRFVNPDPLTGMWVHEYFAHMYDLTMHGRPIQPAALYDDGVVRQLCERCVLESNGRGEPTIGGVGQALAYMTSGRYPEWPTTKPLL